MSSPAPLLRWLAVAALCLAPLHAQFVVPGPDLRLNGSVFAVERDGSGNVYLGGSFNEFNGDDSSGLGLLRLTPGGTKHAAWDIGFINGVSDLLVHGNFLYVAGGFGDVRTLSQGILNRSRLLRIHLSGANEGKVDTTWTPVVNGAVGVLETDGTSLFIAGSFTTVNGAGRTRMAKILIGSGTPHAVDSSWNPAPDNRVTDLKFAGGWLYASGAFHAVGGNSDNYLARLSTGGSGGADSAWHPDIDRPVSNLEASATHLYFGGDFVRVHGVNHRSVGRYAISDTPAFDGTWKPDPDGEVSSMALSGSSLYIGGVFTKVGGANRRFMAKINASGTGSLDGSFLPQPNGAIEELKTAGSGVLAVGRFNTTTGAASAGYALMDGTTGSASAAFAGSITTEGQIYAMQPVTGGMIVGGLFDSVGGVPRTSIAKINSDGTLDTGFNAPLVGFNRLVSDIKLDGSTLYFCGDFLTVGGAPTKHVARVNAATGAVDAGWFTNPLTPILCIETDANYAYIGSAGLRFIEISPNNAVQVANLARLSKGASATLDQIWKPYIAAENGDPAVASINDMVISGGNLIIGGHFIFVVNPDDIGNPFQRLCVASLSTTGWGQPAGGWNTQFYDELDKVASIYQLLLHNNSLYVAGNFAWMQGTPGTAEWFGVAKLHPGTGAWDVNFDASPIIYDGVAHPGRVRTLAASGSQIYLGGDFDYVYDWGDDDYYWSPDIARVDQNSGWPDLSWYPYPNEAVSAIAFAGSNLWMHGSFGMIGDTVVDGPAIVTPFSGSYQSWLSTWFTPGQIASPEFTAPFQDPDGDGDSNLVESFFNTNPFDGKKTYHAAGTGTSGLPLIRRENISGQNYLTVEYTRWKSSANAKVTATPQFSDNLASWPRAGVMIGSPVSISTDRERVKFRDSVANLPKSFGRVQVLTQP